MNIFEYNFEYIQRYKNDNNQRVQRLYIQKLLQKNFKKKSKPLLSHKT